MTKILGAIRLTCGITAALAFACAGDETVEGTDNTPTGQINAKVYALSTYSASVGTMVEAYGADFPRGVLGRSQLRFLGTFRTASGANQPVTPSSTTSGTEPAR